MTQSRQRDAEFEKQRQIEVSRQDGYGNSYDTAVG